MNADLKHHSICKLYGNAATQCGSEAPLQKKLVWQCRHSRNLFYKFIRPCLDHGTNRSVPKRPMNASCVQTVMRYLFHITPSDQPQSWSQSVYKVTLPWKPHPLIIWTWDIIYQYILCLGMKCFQLTMSLPIYMYKLI